jgi:hypothetical protein
MESEAAKERAAQIARTIHRFAKLQNEIQMRD